MFLHKLHNKPEELDHYDDLDLVPSIAWEKYKNSPDELRKREKLWVRAAETVYYYAKKVLNGPFPLGEPAIAKDAQWSYMYTYDVLKRKPFKLGEPEIAKDAHWSYMYAVYVLNGQFKLGEPAIAKDPHYSEIYQRFFNK